MPADSSSTIAALRKDSYSDLCDLFNELSLDSDDASYVGQKVKQEAHKGFAVIGTLKRLDCFSPNDPVIEELKVNSYTDLRDVFNHIIDITDRHSNDAFTKSIIDSQARLGYEAITVLERLNNIASRANQPS